jgi:hypothetical protein
MNYYRLLLLTLLCGIAQLTSAQRKVLLKVDMAPNKTYKGRMVNDINIKMNAKGDSAMMARLKEEGTTFPIAMLMNQHINTTIKTSARRNDKRIPLVITYDSFKVDQSINGQPHNFDQPNPFANTIIRGSTNGDGKISIDTVEGEIDEVVKTSIQQLINNIQGNIKFPDSEIKIGDSFDQEVPMDLPIPNVQSKMVLNIHYTLKEIKDDQAIFDLQQKIHLEMNMSDKERSANGAGSGSGAGTMTFDMRKKIVAKSEADTQYQFEFTMSGLTMQADCKMKTLIENTAD